MEKKITSNDFFWTFIRSNFLQASWNMERMQALGYCFGMVPILRRLYEGDELKKAIKRHLEFYNTQPFVTAPIVGVTKLAQLDEAIAALSVKLDAATVRSLEAPYRPRAPAGF